MSVCSQCDGEVVWIRVDGKAQCFNVDGVTMHWDACSKRRWQQTVSTGVRFEAEVDPNSGQIGSGYAKSVHGTKFERIAAKTVRGKNYRPFTHQAGCNAAPWESCSCPT